MAERSGADQVSRDERLAILLAHEVDSIDDFFGSITCGCGIDIDSDFGAPHQGWREKYAQHLADALEPDDKEGGP